ncbi:MAG: septal ring lytic transglycosylase RlpA family protein [Treponema sp.]|jgi:hypothetical protein|nr:septal ring lytic transglycosylase RlpA family protein [Treponema sp.]
MKRLFFLVLLAIVPVFLFAQRNFSQKGPGTATINSPNLSLIHPSLAIGTQVRVTNTENGKESMATVTGRIAASTDRIADVSTGLAAVLEMSTSGATPILIETVSPPRTPKPQPVAAATEPAEERPPEEPPAEPPPEEPPAEEPPAEEPAEEPKGNPPAEEAPKGGEPAKTDPQQKDDRNFNIYNIIMSPGAMATGSEVTYADPAKTGGEGGGNSGSAAPVIVPPAAAPAPVIVTPTSPATSAPSSAPAPVQQIFAPIQAPSTTPASTVQQPVTQPVAPGASPPPAYASAPAAQPPVYAPAPQAPAYAPAPQPLAYAPAPAAPAPAAQAPAYAPPPQPPAYAPAPVPAYAQPSAGAPARIMPAVPAVGSGNYRVQVGSFANEFGARQFYDLLQRGGFSPAYERYESYIRVVLARVNAADLPEVARRLGLLGIREVWIRKE